MNDRPTPESDETHRLNCLPSTTEDTAYRYVLNLSRRLERERDDLLDRLTALEQSMPIELAKIEREREEALEELQALKEARNGPER